MHATPPSTRLEEARQCRLAEGEWEVGVTDRDGGEGMLIDLVDEAEGKTLVDRHTHCEFGCKVGELVRPERCSAVDAFSNRPLAIATSVEVARDVKLVHEVFVVQRCEPTGGRGAVGKREPLTEALGEVGQAAEHRRAPGDHRVARTDSHDERKPLVFEVAASEDDDAHRRRRSGVGAVDRQELADGRSSMPVQRIDAFRLISGFDAQLALPG